MNTITFKFKSTECNGYPKIFIKVDSEIVYEHHFTSINIESISVNIPNSLGEHVVEIERFGKNESNFQLNDSGNIVKDQILEIVNIQIDGIDIPNFVIQKNSSFSWDNETHMGSTYFGPNGVWKFVYYNSLISFILNEKILHESQYNQDYKYPWSYKLGPDSVKEITDKIEMIINKVNRIL